MKYAEIEYGVSEGIATITLNRPDKMNAYTLVMDTELRHALNAADADDDVRVVIVTGAGAAFCAGPICPLPTGPSTIRPWEWRRPWRHTGTGVALRL